MAFESAPHIIMRSRTKQTETLRLSPPRSPAPKPDRPTDRPKCWAKSHITETRSHEERTSRNTYIFCTVRISSGRRQQPAGLRIDQKSMSKNDQNFDRKKVAPSDPLGPARRNALASWGVAHSAGRPQEARTGRLESIKILIFFWTRFLIVF